MTPEFWTVIKNNLKSRNENNKLLDTWLDPVELTNVDKSNPVCRMRLGVPSQLHKYWIVENLFDRICSEISAVYHKPFEIEFVIMGQSLNLSPDNANSIEQALTLQNQENEASSQGQSGVQSGQSQAYKRPMDYNASHDQIGSRNILNGDFTFSTFVVGRNNEFAHAASFNVAQNPGADGYNPLFICGPVGMGKTHLLNAVGNQIRQSLPDFRICYVSAERFLNECISAIRRNEMEKFRLRFRERCDVLLVDDVHVFGRGEAVQEEFFHTLNDFFEKKRQVVVASDRMPKDIHGLEDRIRSRLEWGLIADIQMPDIETRVAILRYKAERLGLKIPEDVVNHIARISKRSIRELEGNLKKVKMFSELQGLHVDIELTKKVLAHHDDPTSITIDDIQRLVADHYQVRMADLKSKGRAKTIVVPRQMAMFLIKKHLNRSLIDIGRAFGGKDHTTVINAVNRIDSKLQTDSDLKKDFEELTTRIHNITGL